MKTMLVKSLCLSIATTLLSYVAVAQTEAAQRLYISAATVPTNVAGIYTYAAPPTNFKFQNATDEELATYGLPARPDKQANPERYQLWERVMVAAQNRWNGDLKPLVREKSPQMMSMPEAPREMRSGAGPALPTTPTTLNWSGVALTKSLKKLGSGSFRDIYSIVSVPTGEQPFAVGGCDQYYQLSWMGLDGYTKLAAIQPTPPRSALMGGLVSYMTCGPTQVHYAVAFGWDPTYIQTAFFANPGDIVYAEVTSPPGGTNPAYLFLEDLTTLTYQSFSVPVPYGVTFIGSSAQWIVERWCCRNSGYPYPLLNTISTFFDGGAALDGAGHTYYPGSQAVSTQVITMRDDSNSQNIQLINQGSSGFEGQHALLFQTTGCAFTGGCTKK